MNTYPDTTIPAFLADVDLHRLRDHWRALVCSEARHRLRPEHFLLYQALRGKDWRTSFAPITNTRKLDNGGFWAWGRLRALAAIHSSVHEENLLQPFGGLVTAEILEQVRTRLPRRVQDAEATAYLEVADA